MGFTASLRLISLSFSLILPLYDFLLSLDVTLHYQSYARVRAAKQQRLLL
ncbi:hypothetical protein ACN3E9_16745 [Vibrio pectenicida]